MKYLIVSLRTEKKAGGVICSAVSNDLKGHTVSVGKGKKKTSGSQYGLTIFPSA